MYHIPKISFLQIAKHPLVYLVVMLVSLLWYFVHGFSNASAKVDANCEHEKLQLRNDLHLERQRNDDLVLALLVKNGVIDELKRVADTLASAQASIDGIHPKTQ